MTKGAVSCELAIASEVGKSILERGGSAADAIIATTLCVGTIANYHSGICGGGFALIRSPEGEMSAIDFRVTAPAAATPDVFKSDPFSTIVGALSVAVPGELKMFEAIHKKYGKLPWATLFEPAIKFAEEGWIANEDLIKFLHEKTHKTYEFGISGPPTVAESWIHDDTHYARLFSRPGREFVRLGETIKHPEFAETLKTIGEKGAGVFYEGEIAQGMVDAVQEGGGVMTMEDLKDYKINWSEPLSIEYKGTHKVHTTPAPSSGACLLLALNTLSNFKSTTPESVLDTHRLIEALKFTYGQRALFGDPAFIPEVAKLQESFLRPSTGKQIHSMITDEKTHPPEYYNSGRFEIKEDNGTSQITAMDESGLTISLTTTITLFWGSRIITKHGVVLNNGMSDFSVEGQSNMFGYVPTPANFIAPGKRPLSSQCPYIIEDLKTGDVVFAGGAAGGSRILSGNVQVARNVLDYGMTCDAALRANRIHDQLAPNETHLELPQPSRKIAGASKELIEGLKGLGHNVTMVPMAFSTAGGIKVDQGVHEAHSEPRKVCPGGAVSLK